MVAETGGSTDRLEPRRRLGPLRRAGGLLAILRLRRHCALLRVRWHVAKWVRRKVARTAAQLTHFAHTALIALAGTASIWLRQRVGSSPRRGAVCCAALWWLLRRLGKVPDRRFGTAMFWLGARRDCNLWCRLREPRRRMRGLCQSRRWRRRNGGRRRGWRGRCSGGCRWRSRLGWPEALGQLASLLACALGCGVALSFLG